MESKDFDRMLNNLKSLAGKHTVRADLILDGSKAVEVRMEKKDEKLVARVNITDLRKALTTPEILKTGLSFLARRKKPRDDFEVKIEAGVLKKLFGKN